MFAATGTAYLLGSSGSANLIGIFTALASGVRAAVDVGRFACDARSTIPLIMMLSRAEQERARQLMHGADEMLLAVARATEQQVLEALLTRLKRLSETSASQVHRDFLSDRDGISEMAAHAAWEGTIANSHADEIFVLFFVGIFVGFATFALL